MLKWLKPDQRAMEARTFADQVASELRTNYTSRRHKRPWTVPRQTFEAILHRVDRELRPLALSAQSGADFVEEFEQRLLELRVARELAAELAKAIGMRLALHSREARAASRLDLGAELLFAEGESCLDSGDYARAIGIYEDLSNFSPHRAKALLGLGLALRNLGRYTEAETQWRSALKLAPDDAVIHNHLGQLLHLQGRTPEAQQSLRRALALAPDYIDATINLATSLVYTKQLRTAEELFSRVLRLAADYPEALIGLASIAEREGRFVDAEVLLRRVLETRSDTPLIWTSLISLRKMTAADRPWLEGAERQAAQRLPSMYEAMLRFAIGKFHDDVGDYPAAFENFRRANELFKALAPPYNPDGHRRFVDDLVRVYTPSSITPTPPGASPSRTPVLIVGMMRSGTTLAEQILASHPAIKGAGELAFWSQTVREHEAELRAAPPDENLRKQVADAYLRTLATYSTDARYVIDKAPVNADYLGIIHSVFPNARFIYLRRNPIDVCLSCYFQRFPPSLNFTMDLSDLARYYREHHRLMTHWRTVLPTGTLLDLPYEALVADPEGWTRRMLEFLELDWDARCLDFHQTQRVVATASAWQVRQKMYRSSVERWRNYEAFIGPLLELRNLD